MIVPLLCGYGLSKDVEVAAMLQATVCPSSGVISYAIIFVLFGIVSLDL